MTKILRTLLVAGGLCVWSGSLWASLMASTSISAIRVNVIDTNLDDGIDASVNWMLGDSWANACLDIPGDGDCNGATVGGHHFTPSINGPVSAAGSYQGIDGLSYVDDGEQFAQISGVPLSGQRSVNAARYGILQLVGEGRVEFEMDYTLTAAAEGESWLNESLAYAGIMVSSWDAPMTENNIVLVRPFEGTSVIDGTISNSFSGTDGTWFSVLFHAHTHLKSYETAVADVPEPGSLALSAAALCALGRFGRRRSRK